MQKIILLPSQPARKVARQNTRFVIEQTEGSAMKTWIDGAGFADLYREGRASRVKVQATEGGYVLTFFLDKQRRAQPVLKAREREIRVWSNLDRLIQWIVENTDLKEITISLEKES